MYHKQPLSATPFLQSAADLCLNFSVIVLRFSKESKQPLPLLSEFNPLIGSAGVSAVPMAARVSQMVGQKYNPGNFLLMHAMGPNVAGVIGSAIAAGVLISLYG